MGKKSWKYSYANGVLALFAVLLFLSAPFSGTFWGGLLFHTSMAATVAGLADWYAVVSLFRKPLGIAYHTALIPRGKTRIIGILRKMIEEELLTVPHLYQTVKKHSPGTLIYEWMQKNRKEIIRGISLFLSGTAAQIRDSEWIHAERFFSQQFIRKTDWAALLIYMADQIMDKNSTVDFGRLLSSWLQQILNSDMMKSFFPLFYDKVWKDYEEKGAGRGVVRSLLENQKGVTDEAGGELIRSRLLQWAEDLGREGTSARSEAGERLIQFCGKLHDDTLFRSRANRWVQNQMISFLKQHPSFLEEIRRKLTGQEQIKKLSEKLTDLLLKKMQNQMMSEEKRKETDRWILLQSARAIRLLQRQMGKAAEDELLRYTGEDMAHMAENSVSRDLQMIRINGSVVGAVLGSFFYLLMHIPKGGLF